MCFINQYFHAIFDSQNLATSSLFDNYIGKRDLIIDEKVSIFILFYYILYHLILSFIAFQAQFKSDLHGILEFLTNQSEFLLAIENSIEAKPYGVLRLTKNEDVDEKRRLIKSNI